MARSSSGRACRIAAASFLLSALAISPAAAASPAARATSLRAQPRVATRARPLAAAEPPISTEAAFAAAAHAAMSARAAADATLPPTAVDPAPARPRSGGGVYLVGTGPGDPELLTLKAFRLLASAELVLYDRLVSAEILKLASPSATLVYVGKERCVVAATACARGETRARAVPPAPPSGARGVVPVCTACGRHARVKCARACAPS
jgi:hypothetical protein